MNAKQGNWISAAVAMVAIVAAACAGAPAHAADDHHHGAATPTKLSLDQGRKWPTDESLRNGMSLYHLQSLMGHTDIGVLRQ